MKKFITLTDFNNDPIIFNVDNIGCIQSDFEGKTCIYFEHGNKKLKKLYLKY